MQLYSYFLCVETQFILMDSRRNEDEDIYIYVNYSYLSTLYEFRNRCKA